jgi:hypothetical protein
MPWPSWRELARIVRRDHRRSDVYTNARCLRRLAARGLLDVLAVTNRARQEYLAERGIEAAWVPLGYDAEHYGNDLGGGRDLDVLYLGARDIPRRERALRRLRRRGVRIEVAGDYQNPAYWDAPRTQLLNRTKILLNLLRFPHDLTDSRLLLGMANRTLVISEPIYRPDPFVPGVHFVEATIEDMPHAIARYLTDATARARIVDAAYAFVTEELTLARSAARMLELVERHRALRGNARGETRRPTCEPSRGRAR